MEAVSEMILYVIFWVFALSTYSLEDIVCTYFFFGFLLCRLILEGRSAVYTSSNTLPKSGQRHIGQ
jgi:hypothetical protein